MTIQRAFLGTAMFERWTETFPEARMIRFEDAGHFPQEEAPDAVVDAIR